VASVTPTVAHVVPTARPTVAGPAPTATATRVPPTPTPIPVPGQLLTVRGDVTSVSASTNTFTVHVPNGGGNYTVTVTPGVTTWSGVATSITTLTTAMGVDASGTYQGGGNLNPTTHVSSDT
jgi:hypothetical protein